MTPFYVLTMYIRLLFLFYGYLLSNSRYHLYLDDQKALLNVRKPDIHFEQATEAFFDPFLKIIDASRHLEERDAVIGMDRRWQLLFVVHTEIIEDRIRLMFGT